MDEEKRPETRRHEMTKDCWCEPTVEHVPSKRLSLPKAYLHEGWAGEQKPPQHPDGL